MEDGYEFFAKRQLVTLFSAPNYCGEFDNAGAMMSVDETLMCSFQVFYKSYVQKGSLRSAAATDFIRFKNVDNCVLLRVELNLEPERVYSKSMTSQEHRCCEPTGIRRPLNKRRMWCGSAAIPK